MHRGVLQYLGNFRKVHFTLPDHKLALLELGPADVLTWGNLQILMEECS